MNINRALIPSMILTATIVAGGCNNKPEPQSSEVSAPVMETTFASKPSHKDIEKLLTVKRRKVKASNSKMALEKMGFDEMQNGAIKWTDKSGKNGDVTYKNLTVTGKDGEDISMKSLTLTGAHMDGDTPGFDRLDISGLNVSGKDDVVSVDRVSMSRPSPELGASIMEAIEIIQTSGKLSKLPSLSTDNIGFGALLIDDLKVTSDEAMVTLGSAGWGEDEKSNKALFLLEDLQVETPDKRRNPGANITLGSISATDIDMNMVRELRESKGATGNMQAMPGSFNIFSPVMGGFSMRDFKLTSDSLYIKAPAVDSVVDRKGKVVTITQSLSPATFGFSERPANGEMAKIWDTLETAGYDELEFSGSSVTRLDEASDTISVDKGVFTLKDGFDLNYDFKGRGFNAASQGGDEAPLDVMALDRMTLSLKDNSLLDRVIKVGMEKQGLPEVFFRMMIKGSIMGGGAMAAQQAETPAQEAAISDMANALGGFIDHGGTITVKMRPPEPVSMMEISQIQPQAFDPDKLGLTITHKK